MIAGNGFSSTRVRHAFSYEPSSASYSHFWMFSPAGQAWLHGGSRSTYIGRSTRHEPVSFARLEPTSSVIANGFSITPPPQFPELVPQGRRERPRARGARTARCSGPPSPE